MPKVEASLVSLSLVPFPVGIVLMPECVPVALWIPVTLTPVALTPVALATPDTMRPVDVALLIETNRQARFQSGQFDVDLIIWRCRITYAALAVPVTTPSALEAADP